MDELLEALSFTKGVALGHDAVFLSMTADEMAVGEATPHAVFASYRSGRLNVLDKRAWWSAGVATLGGHPEECIGLGEYGSVVIFHGAHTSEEQIDIPDQFGPLRGVRAIGKVVYAVGADQQVYLRQENGGWIDTTPGLQSAQKGEPITFEAVDGFSEDEIYVCGWDGEIWRREGGQWLPCNAPTNLILSDLCCAGDGCVYACGQAGVIVHGRRAEWSVTTIEELPRDLWGIRWFRDRIYVSSMQEIFEFSGGEVVPCLQALTVANTFYGLSIAEDTLWSIGPKDLARFDGKKWERITGGRWVDGSRRS